MPERDFEPQRMVWLGPLTIVSAVMAVLATRRVALLVSFFPDLLLLGSAPWPPVAVLMAEHVAAWFVTVELLTRIA